MKKSSTHVAKRKKATKARKSISAYGKGGNNDSKEILAQKGRQSPPSSPAKKKLPKITTDDLMDKGVPKLPPSSGTTLISSVNEQSSTETYTYLDNNLSHNGVELEHKAHVATDNGTLLQTIKVGGGGLVMR